MALLHQQILGETLPSPSPEFAIFQNERVFDIDSFNMLSSAAMHCSFHPLDRRLSSGTSLSETLGAMSISILQSLGSLSVIDARSVHFSNTGLTSSPIISLRGILTIISCAAALNHVAIHLFHGLSTYHSDIRVSTPYTI